MKNRFTFLLISFFCALSSLGAQDYNPYKEVSTHSPNAGAIGEFGEIPVNPHLLELSELSEFINKNRHLPDVPSESDVAANGINVGERNAVLLKKIEELPLYILQQAKEIEAIKSKLDL